MKGVVLSSKTWPTQDATRETLAMLRTAWLQPYRHTRNPIQQTDTRPYEAACEELAHQRRLLERMQWQLQQAQEDLEAARVESENEMIARCEA